MRRYQAYPPLIQVAIGILVSVLLCLALILVGHRFNQFHSYRDLFFDYWAQYVCGVLTLWGIWILVGIWRVSIARARSLSSFQIPNPDSIRTEADVEEFISNFSEAGSSSGDKLISEETDLLVSQVKAVNDTTVLLPSLDTRMRKWDDLLNNQFTSVRILCWVIPAVGLTGATLAVGQAVNSFGAFLAAGDHMPEEVRRALASAESNLAAGSEPLIVAVLFTLVLAVLWCVGAQQAKKVLEELSDICRAFILVLVNWQPNSNVPHHDRSKLQLNSVHPGTAIEQDQVVAIRATLQSIRVQVRELRPTLRELAKTLDQNTANEAPRVRGASAGG